MCKKTYLPRAYLTLQEYVTHACKCFSYTKLTFSNDSGSHQLELGWIQVKNLLPDSPYKEVLTTQEHSGSSSARRLALRIYSKDKAPVGGIGIKEHFEVKFSFHKCRSPHCSETVPHSQMGRQFSKFHGLDFQKTILCMYTGMHVYGDACIRRCMYTEMHVWFSNQH